MTDKVKIKSRIYSDIWYKKDEIYDIDKNISILTDFGIMFLTTCGTGYICEDDFIILNRLEKIQRILEDED